MKIKQDKQKLKFESKLSDELLGLRGLEPDFIVKKLENDIELREMPIEKRIRLSKNLNRH
jgi:hypothetical protein